MYVLWEKSEIKDARLNPLVSRDGFVLGFRVDGRWYRSLNPLVSRDGFVHGNSARYASL